MCTALISAAAWLALAPSAAADGTVAGGSETPTPECTTYYPSSVLTGSDVIGGSGSATAVSGGTDTGVVQTDTVEPGGSGVATDTSAPTDTSVPTDSGVPTDTAAPTDTGIPTDTAVPSGPVTACVLGAAHGSGGHRVAFGGNDTGFELLIAAALLVVGVGLSVLTGRRSAKHRVP